MPRFVLTALIESGDQAWDQFLNLDSLRCESWRWDWSSVWSCRGVDLPTAVIFSRNYRPGPEFDFLFLDRDH